MKGLLVVLLAAACVAGFVMLRRPDLVPGQKWHAYESDMTTALVELAKHQDEYHAAHNRYAKSISELPGFRSPPNVLLGIQIASASAWSGKATHPRLYRVCSISMTAGSTAQPICEGREGARELSASQAATAPGTNAPVPPAIQSGINDINRGVARREAAVNAAAQP